MIKGYDADMQSLIDRLSSEEIDPLPIYRSKRFADILLSGIGLVAFLPVCFRIAMAIRREGNTDPKARGPMFYKQQRIGRGGKPFTIIKFRTMYVDADKRLSEVMENGYKQSPFDSTGYDPRVTKVGRILRESHLDELPQLWTVLRGDMSLVGPRPFDTYRDRLLVDAGDISRFRCKPGLTGDYQTCEKTYMTAEGVKDYDEGYAGFYENEYSLLRDHKCLLGTASVCLRKYFRARRR